MSTGIDRPAHGALVASARKKPGWRARGRRLVRAIGDGVSRLTDSRVAMVGTAIVGFWVLAALFAPWITSYTPYQQDVTAIIDPTPSATHVLGADLLGRDVWARLAFGARTVLTIAPLALLAAYCVGIAIGLTAGYFGGWVDICLSRLSDVVLSFPVIILYILFITAIGPSAGNIILAVILGSAPGIGRIVRGLTLDLKPQEFVDAARVRGESSLYIMLVELLPNMRGTLIVDACLRMGYTVMKIGVLGFLGLGLPPPDPDWGGMVKESTSVIMTFPHMALIPCVAISSLAIAFNLISDGLGEISRQR